LSTPALLPQLLSPIKGTKGTTGRIVIPNLHRRRSGSATVFILPRLLGCVYERIISAAVFEKQLLTINKKAGRKIPSGIGFYLKNKHFAVSSSTAG
ncbi:MAG: hypothetical protein IJP05_07935, partial [Oscillospiraceae bacterium]|nr:hypothetical protein [Oscillospiraceae bacterium]